MRWLAPLALFVCAGRTSGSAQAPLTEPPPIVRSAPRSEPSALLGPQPQGERPLLVRLAPTARELHAQRTAELERRIERTLLNLPEIAAAHVQLTLPLEAEAALDQPLAKPSAVLLLTLRTSAPSDRDYAGIVTSALSGHTPSLTIIRRPLVVAPSERLVKLGPFRVEERSALALRATLTVTLITNALLALWVLHRVRSRSTRRTES